MNRRDFMRIAGLTGLGLSLGTHRSWATTEGIDQPLFLSVHAGGGWDPTSFCDPKGRVDENALDPVNHYFVDQIQTPSESSPLKWAPQSLFLN